MRRAPSAEEFGCGQTNHKVKMYVARSATSISFVVLNCLRVIGYSATSKCARSRSLPKYDTKSSATARAFAFSRTRSQETETALRHDSWTDRHEQRVSYSAYARNAECVLMLDLLKNRLFSSSHLAKNHYYPRSHSILKASMHCTLRL